MNCIETSNLHKSFGSVKALQKVDVVVKKGSIHGFLGPNGAGKTTTIKTILGLLKANQGHIKVFDQKVQFGQTETLLQEIGYLPQDPVFPEHYNAIEVMELTAQMYGISRQVAVPRIKELLKYYELNKDATRLVKNYSKGMKQRLGLATVWLPEPKLLILDEPVSALDPEGRYYVLEQIKQIKNQGTTVFFSSHILSDVERVADKVTIINKGQILLEKSTDDMRSNYVGSAYVVKVTPEQQNQAQQLLQSLDEVKNVTVKGSSISFQNPQAEPAEFSKLILNTLLHSDIGVLKFTTVEPTLEDVFLNLINGGESA